MIGGSSSHRLLTGGELEDVMSLMGREATFNVAD